MNTFNTNQWACVFPGIGAQLQGKEPAFFHRYHSIISPFIDKASEDAGEDLREIINLKITTHFGERARELFAYAFSCGFYAVLQEKRFKPKVLAGHSLGIYSALVTATCISYEDGLQIINMAHSLAREKCVTQEFGAIVILGLLHDEIIAAIQKTDWSSLYLANLNSPTSGVYVGYRKETDMLLDWAKQAGAFKTIRLPLNAPYHNPMFMDDCSLALKNFLENIEWSHPDYPIVSALDHSLLTTSQEVMKMTVANLSTPIHWPGVMNKFSQMNIESVMECGAGISLSQHSHFIDSCPRHYNLRNLKKSLNY